MPNTMMRPRDPGSTAMGHLLVSEAANRSRRVAGGNRERCHVGRHHRPNTHDGTGTDGDAWQHTAVEPDPGAAANRDRPCRRFAREPAWLRLRHANDSRPPRLDVN